MPFVVTFIYKNLLWNIMDNETITIKSDQQILMTGDRKLKKKREWQREEEGKRSTEKKAKRKQRASQQEFHRSEARGRASEVYAALE